MYHAGGTNGALYADGHLQCFTIELPWRNNLPGLSCIPEGRYRLRYRYSKRHRKHLLVEGVKGRTLILIHPANDASKELRGCIAPVSQLTGIGRGAQSRIAFSWLMGLLEPFMEMQALFLHIKKAKDDHFSTIQSPHAAVF
jgi:hypothetical protein